MIPEIQSGLASIKAATGITKALIDLRDSAKINEAVIDLQSKILSVHEALFGAHEKICELMREKAQIQSQLDAMQEWKQLSEQYKPYDLTSGIIVYVRCDEQNPRQSISWSCPRCFQNRKISLFSKLDVDNRNFKCVTCEFEILPSGWADLPWK